MAGGCGVGRADGTRGDVPVEKTRLGIRIGLPLLFNESQLTSSGLYPVEHFRRRFRLWHFGTRTHLSTTRQRRYPATPRVPVLEAGTESTLALWRCRNPAAGRDANSQPALPYSEPEDERFKARTR
jgi:hypothetical protein